MELPDDEYPFQQYIDIDDHEIGTITLDRDIARCFRQRSDDQQDKKGLIAFETTQAYQPYDNRY